MRVISIVVLLFCGVSVFGQDVKSEEAKKNKVVQVFIDCIKHNNKTKLASLTEFPIRRGYPIPSIKNSAGLLKCYARVFDDSLVQLISHSDPAADWSTVGWRGIMLLNGVVWLNTDGKLIAVNYQSAAEAKLQASLIAAGRLKLHPSLRVYEKPVLIMETSKYKIRIDDMGDHHYRYASWSKKGKMSDQPDVIILNGVLDFDGTGGNHSYTFTNDGYSYECYIDEMGARHDIPTILTVKKSEKQLMSQKGRIVAP